MLNRSSKNIFNSSKMQIWLRNKTRLGNNFLFKDRIPNELTCDVIYKFQGGLCKEPYHAECLRHLNARIGKNVGISLLTKKQVKPKNSFVADHLLFCNHSVSYDYFRTLTRENKAFLLELKESPIIMRD